LGADRFFYQPSLVKQFLEKISSNNLESKTWLLFSIFFKNNCKFIGSCGLKVNHKNKEAEIFYLLSPLYWNKGFTTEACRSIIDEISKKISLKKINALILPENFRAQRVAEKTSFRFIKETKINRYGQILHVQLWSLSLSTE